LDYGHSLRRELGSLEAEMKRGAPPYQLIHAHLRSLHPNPQLINDYLPMLRRAKIGQFRFLRDNPQFQQTTVPLTPLEMRNATFDDGAFHTTGPDSAIIFAVPHSLQAAGIRLKYIVENKQGTPPLFWIAWRGDDTSSFATDRSYYISPTGDRANWERGSWLRIGHQETELTLWVCDRIRQIRIKPDAQACVFRLAEITLLSD
jgi:hypothetical protein